MISKYDESKFNFKQMNQVEYQEGTGDGVTLKQKTKAKMDASVQLNRV